MSAACSRGQQEELSKLSFAPLAKRPRPHCRGGGGKGDSRAQRGCTGMAAADGSDKQSFLCNSTVSTELLSKLWREKLSEVE